MDHNFIVLMKIHMFGRTSPTTKQQYVPKTCVHFEHKPHSVCAGEHLPHISTLDRPLASRDSAGASSSH